MNVRRAMRWVGSWGSSRNLGAIRQVQESVKFGYYDELTTHVSETTRMQSPKHI